MNQWNNPKLAISLLIIMLFGYAYLRNPSDETMKGAVILAFATAYGFWLGKNSADDEKTQNTGKLADAFKAVAESAPIKAADTGDALQSGDTVKLEQSS